MSAAYTGLYRYRLHRDKDSIETVRKFQRADLKTFKQAKDVSTEWLTKENAVRQTHDEFMQWDTPREGT